MMAHKFLIHITKPLLRFAPIALLIALALTLSRVLATTSLSETRRSVTPRFPARHPGTKPLAISPIINRKYGLEDVVEQNGYGSVQVADAVNWLSSAPVEFITLNKEEVSHKEARATVGTFQIAEAELLHESKEIAIENYTLQIQQPYHNLMEYSTDSFLVTDAKGQILAANQASERLLRRTKSELSGQHIVEFIPSHELPNLRDRLAAVTETDALINWETSLQPATGSVVSVSINIYGVRDTVTKTYSLHWQIREIVLRTQPQNDDHEHQMFLHAFHDILTVLSEKAALEDVLDQALKGIRLIAPFDFAGILLKEQEGLRLARSFGYVEGSYPSPETVIMSLCVPGQTTSVEEYLINSKQPLLITDEAALSKWPLLPTAQPVRSMQAIPLAYPGGVIGALLLCSATPDFFTDARIERLQLFTVQTTVAIQYAQWNQMTRYLAILEERERVAHELHDTVNQRLFSMSIIADVLPELWQTKPIKAQAMLDQLRVLNRGALEEMRTFLRSLRTTSEK
jgi:PAS domain S-box-containing protein